MSWIFFRMYIVFEYLVMYNFIKQHFCFIPRFTSVDREGRSTSHFHLWQTWRFEFQHYKFSVLGVAIFKPRPPMASLFRNLYDMTGPSPRIDVLFWGRRDFQISISNRDTSRIDWNRHWGSFMVDTGILSNNMKFPSHEC